jgi:26S proteasome regulatory subunit N2
MSLRHAYSLQSPSHTQTCLQPPGTTKDNFLRENLEWLGKATNWAKFTAVASIGVVHKGHVRESMNLLQPYLPQGN